jgi:hypothetical protein
MTTLKRLAARFLPVLALAAFAAGCEDLTGGNSNTVYRVVISDVATGATLVTINGDRTLSGSLTVPAGGTRAIELRLLNSSGGTIQVGSGDDIRVLVTNSVLVGFTPTLLGAGTLRGNLQGKAGGNTTLVVQYLEGGLLSYESASVTVSVT